MKLLLIKNPASHSGRSKKLWSFWEAGLKKKGVDYDSIITEKAGHALDIARSTQDHVVVAIGGDGTINEVLDGVMQAGQSELPMGILYSGTSPDFCQFHGVPISPSAALDALIVGRSAMVDVAKISYTSKNGEKISSHFGCGSNVGLGATVARTSNCLRKFTGDTLGTSIALIGAISMMKPMDLKVIIDGSPCNLARVNNISVLKSPYIASGLRLNLKLSPDDGKLAIFAVQQKNRFNIWPVLPGFYTGKAVGRKDVFHRTCSRVTIECSEKREVEFDGDPRGFLPIEIKIMPSALRLIGASK